jgi:uncharacterized protein YndB with AHSA1/START domain
MTNAVMGNQTETKQTHRLEIVRMIKASKQRVFDAWIRPQNIRQWFSPGSMVVQEANLDARVDGNYKITSHGSPMPGVEERTAKMHGRYLRVEPYDLLSFTWSANFAPGEECVVTITLKDVAGGTEMTLTQEGFALESSREGYTRGWSSSLEKLTRLLETA